MSQILVIQTAFLGDTILATALLEELKVQYPHAQIDYLVRKGNESLFIGHPFIRHLLVWDKKTRKYANLVRLLRLIRATGYDKVVNTQRFAATGLLTGLSGAAERIGFNKNPFSFLFTRRVRHEYNLHEVHRNLNLVREAGATGDARPRLYPQQEHFDRVRAWQGEPYLCIAPASVWFTKQFPKEKWVEFLDRITEPMLVNLIGGPGDKALAEWIAAHTRNDFLRFNNLCGELALLETAALMKGAMMNYTNDSGPLHIASAMNAPVRAVFCSTVEEFGFGPLSDDSAVIQTSLELRCRPCGLHGHKTCPEGHFKCAWSIELLPDWGD